MDQLKLKQSTLFGSAPIPPTKAVAAAKASVPKSESNKAASTLCATSTDYDSLNPGDVLRRILLAKSSPTSWPRL